MKTQTGNASWMKSLLVVPVVLFAAVLLSLPGLSTLANADALVASNTSHSIEWFTNSGTWIDTFASTGPYGVFALAQSPLTGEIFATTIYANGVQANTILRYMPNGQWGTTTSSQYWSTFTLPTGSYGTNSLLFDKSGNLWVATAIGEDYGVPITIYEYASTSLNEMNPAPVYQFTANLGRGDQMAWDPSGNLCIASFLGPYGIQCFDPATGSLAYDYATELSTYYPTIQPTGIAFDASGRLYVNSVFQGQVLKETAFHTSPFTLLASGTPEFDGGMVLLGKKLLVPSQVVPGGITSDTIYTVNIDTGAVGVFNTPPTPNHVWGAYQIILAKITKCRK